MNQDFLNSAAKSYHAQHTVLGSSLYIWSGILADDNSFINSLSVLDMHSLKSRVIGSKRGWPKNRYGAAGFDWESRFCFHGGKVMGQPGFSHEMWCYGEWQGVKTGLYAWFSFPLIIAS